MMPSLFNGQTSGANESWRHSFLLVHARLPLKDRTIVGCGFWSHLPPHQNLREMWDFGLRWPLIN
jgi:hypothetical protein